MTTLRLLQKVRVLRCFLWLILKSPLFWKPGFFVTKIFHPNIRQPTGEICVNTLKKDWQPSHSLRHVLMVIRCLLIEPFPESALNEEAAKLLLEDYDEYFRRAKMLTSIYASTLGHAESCAKSSESSKAVLKGNMKHKKKSLRRLWRRFLNFAIFFFLFHLRLVAVPPTQVRR